MSSGRRWLSASEIIWLKDNKELPIHGNEYIIPAGELSVKLHDGNWICAGQNMFGTGPNHTIAVHVNRTCLNK